MKALFLALLVGGASAANLTLRAHFKELAADRQADAAGTGDPDEAALALYAAAKALFKQESPTAGPWSPPPHAGPDDARARARARARDRRLPPPPTQANAMCEDETSRSGYMRVQAKVHPEIEWIPGSRIDGPGTFSTLHGMVGGAARLKPGSQLPPLISTPIGVAGASLDNLPRGPPPPSRGGHSQTFSEEAKFAPSAHATRS